MCPCMQITVSSSVLEGPISREAGCVLLRACPVGFLGQDAACDRYHPGNIVYARPCRNTKSRSLRVPRLSARICYITLENSLRSRGYASSTLLLRAAPKREEAKLKPRQQSHREARELASRVVSLGINCALRVYRYYDKTLMHRSEIECI